ncbi:hypothetical protein SUGI_0289630 [Cryptomeria japonica]|nr:hypothetical protein SUGI_0289630 [Cryptomeria japonica]
MYNLSHFLRLLSSFRHYSHLCISSKQNEKARKRIELGTYSMEDLHNPQQCSAEISSPTHQIPNACTNSPSIDPDSKSICPEFESRTGQLVLVSDHDLRNGGLKKLESNSPKKRKPKKKKFCCCPSKSRKQNGENVGAGGKLCNCAASFGGDCAAVCCCCPCALLHLCILALVKFPLCFAKKAICCARKSIPKEEEKEEEDKKGEWKCYTPPWSREESPQRSRHVAVDGLPCSTLENQKIWSELYAGGHLGFGGLLFERSREPQLPSPI